MSGKPGVKSDQASLYIFIIIIFPKCKKKIEKYKSFNFRDWAGKL